MTKDELIEVLAAVEHERWSHWMRHVFSVCIFHEDGSVTIPAKRARRWNNLTALPYADLDEQTKQYDRDEVEKTLKAITDYECVLLQVGEVPEWMEQIGHYYEPDDRLYRRASVHEAGSEYVYRLKSEELAFKQSVIDALQQDVERAELHVREAMTEHGRYRAMWTELFESLPIADSPDATPYDIARGHLKEHMRQIEEATFTIESAE